uniref:Uncharacterized protein n=1 Tax=Romanomermis culicivorax TaxID=13658 RepID=A0A915K0T5_ROMCU
MSNQELVMQLGKLKGIIKALFDIIMSAPQRTIKGKPKVADRSPIDRELGDPFCCGIPKRCGECWPIQAVGKKMMVRHHGIDEADSGVIGLDQTRWIVQTMSLVEEQSKMGCLNGIDNAKFLGPDARNLCKMRVATSGEMGGPCWQ